VTHIYIFISCFCFDTIFELCFDDNCFNVCFDVCFDVLLDVCFDVLLDVCFDVLLDVCFDVLLDVMCRCAFNVSVVMASLAFPCLVALPTDRNDSHLK